LDWKDIEERLIERIGPNYYNYPKSVDWNIRVMKYLDKIRKVKVLEKAAAAYEQAGEDDGIKNGK
jgi:hypothetical protein